MKTINVGNQPEKKIRVAAYARVSTNYTEQLGSCDNQEDMFMEQISSNPEWVFAGIYADPDSTGTTDDRPEFQRMMQDAAKHRFDLVLCKSISRFARNTLISIQTVRRLQDLGINVIFQKEKIDTSNKASEILSVDLIQTDNCGDRLKSPCNQALCGVA